MQNTAVQQQVHFFCDNSDLPATSEHISKLMTALGPLGLLPNTGNEISPQTGMQNKFIIMVSSNDNFQVQFPNREIVFAGQGLTNEAFMEKVVQVMTALADALPYKLSNRVSFLSTLIFKGDDEQYQRAYSNLFNEADSPFEWDYRKAFKYPLNVDNNEIVNLISTVRRCEVQVPLSASFVDSIMLEVDCNTIPQMISHRFTFQSAVEILGELVDKVQVASDELRARV